VFRRGCYFLRGLKLETCTGLKRRILLLTERLAAACSHAVLCNSDSLRNEALALGVAPESKLRVLGSGSSNGVDVERFSRAEQSARTARHSGGRSCGGLWAA